MKTAFTLLSVLFSMGAMAQITITSDWIDQAGGFQAHSVEADSTVFSPGPAGANVSWDFTNIPLPDTAFSFTYFYLLPEQTPYGSEFPKANLVQSILGEDVYSYLLVTDEAIDDYGIAAEDVRLKFLDPQRFIQFPFSFGDSFGDTFEGTFEIEDFTSFFHGTVEVEADGWGSLALHNSFFGNALRVHTHEIQDDSIDLFGVFLKSHRVTDRYFWAVPNYPGPVATYSKISGYDITGVPGFPADTTLIEDSYSFEYDPMPFSSPVKETPLVSNFEIAPNPVTDVIHYTIEHTSSEMMEVSIVDIMGRKIASQNIQLPQGRQTFEMSAPIISGVYYLVLKNNRGIQSAPLLVK